MDNLLILALIALAAPGIFLVDSFSQWAMRLALTETGRRPETVADLADTVSASEAQPETEPDLEHAQAA
jgi:hypothetical protein